MVYLLCGPKMSWPGFRWWCSRLSEWDVFNKRSEDLDWDWKYYTTLLLSFIEFTDCRYNLSGNAKVIGVKGRFTIVRLLLTNSGFCVKNKDSSCLHHCRLLERQAVGMGGRAEWYGPTATFKKSVSTEMWSEVKRQRSSWRSCWLGYNSIIYQRVFRRKKKTDIPSFLYAVSYRHTAHTHTYTPPTHTHTTHTQTHTHTSKTTPFPV